MDSNSFYFDKHFEFLDRSTYRIQSAPRPGGRSMIRVYLSGPITGLSEEEYTRRFARAEQHYRTAGYEVVNPVTIGQELRRGNPEVTYADYMAADLEAMRDCTHIALLEGWENSPGAQCEKREALKLGLEIMQYKEIGGKK